MIEIGLSLWKMIAYTVAIATTPAITMPTIAPMPSPESPSPEEDEDVLVLSVVAVPGLVAESLVFVVSDVVSVAVVVLESVPSVEMPSPLLLLPVVVVASGAAVLPLLVNHCSS